MNHRTFRTRRISIGVVSISSLFVSGFALAGESTATAPDAPAAGVAENGRASILALEVHFDFDATAPDREAVRSALEKELGAPVHLSEGARGLRLVIRDHSLEARFVPDTGTASERKITLPKDAARAIETIALLSGNLVRDEAGELLARLRKPEIVEENPSPMKEAEDAKVGAKKEEEGEKKVAAEKSDEELDEADDDVDDDDEKDENADDDDFPVLVKAPFDVTFLSPVSLHPDLHRRETAFSIGALYTDVGQVRGLAVNGVGLFNRTGGRGLEVAGIWSFTGGPFRGARVGGLVDVGTESATGLFVGGLVSYQNGPVKGLQVAGIYTQTQGKLVGEQTGLVNVAGEVEGTQIGLVNYSGGNVRGAQIGLINIGRGMKGAALGLININPEIDVRFVSWASARFVPQGNAQLADAVMGHVGIQYQSEHFYSLVGFGMSGRDTTCGPTCEEEGVLAPGFGVGYHQKITEHFYAEADVYNQWEVTTRSGTTSQATLGRFAVGYEILPSVALFGGLGPRLDHDFEDRAVSGSPHFFAGVRIF